MVGKQTMPELEAESVWPDYGKRGYGDTMTEKVIVLEKKETLTVVVQDSGGNSITNASVSISGPQSSSGSTGDNGEVTFDPIPAGEYEITVTKDGYFDGTGSVTVP